MKLSTFAYIIAAAAVGLYYGGESLLPGAFCLRPAPVNAGGEVMAALQYKTHSA